MVAIEKQRSADEFTQDRAATDGIRRFQNHAAGALTPDEALVRLVKRATGACWVVLQTDSSRLLQVSRTPPTPAR